MRSVLEHLFGHDIVQLRRSPCPYSSSFAIEEIFVSFTNGSDMTAIFKNVGRDGMLAGALEVKPDFLYDPLREIAVYRSILASLDAGTPKLYGVEIEPDEGRYWLFLEQVPAHPLSEYGEFETWLEVARWLAEIQKAPEYTPSRARLLVPQLLEHDFAYYSRWLQRARNLIGSRLDAISAKYDRVIRVLLELPRTLVHGEFFASNILIQQLENGLRICPIDWEMAAVGPAMMDAAALASGKWTRNERLSIAEAYCSNLPRSLRPADLLTALDCCQCHIAIQWLGWSGRWSPPPVHAQDWLGEVLRLCAEEPLARLLA
jgi:hypothetical protein